MRFIFIYLFAAFLLYSGIDQRVYAEANSPQSVGTKSYYLQPEDVLEISVWKEEGLLREVIVRPDGKLSFPLVGHVEAAGKTPEQLEEIITQRLTKYISDPVANVSVKKTAGNKIYIIGKVVKSGVYVIGQLVDVVQALSLAGGLTPYASADSIKIIRRVGDKELIFPFKYQEIEDGNHLEQNILLKSGDIVMVP